MPKNKLKTPQNPRDEMIRKIAEDTNKTRDLDLQNAPEGELPEIDPETELEPEIEEIDIDNPGSAAIDLSENVDNLETMDNNDPIIHRDGATYVSIKVNGKDREVLIDDVVTSLQKDANADQKLFEANQTMASALKIQQTNASTTIDDSSKSAVVKSDVKAALDKMYDGDIDDATDILAPLFADQSKSANLDEALDQRLDMRDLQDAYKSFSLDDKYKHLVEDPNLLSKVDVLTTELRNDAEYMATNPTYADIFAEAGDRTQDWIASISSSSNADKSSIEVRKANKRSKPKATQAQSSRRQQAPVEKVKTRSEILEGMAAARGQSVLN